MQRTAERKIRATKRELSSLDAAIKETDNDSLKEELKSTFDRSSVKLKKQETQLKDFVNQTGLRRERAREQVSAHFDVAQGKTVAFNKSVSQKAVFSNKKALQIEEEKRIIEQYQQAQELARVRKELADGKYPLTLNIGNQNKHIPTSHAYKPENKKSILYGDVTTAQELINKYSGTGTLKLSDSNKWTNKEFVSLDYDIGEIFDKDIKRMVPTNLFSIHYGKKGAHIVPRKRKE